LVLTFLLGERKAGHLLAHGHEGDVVFGHRVLVFTLQPAQQTEPEIKINKLRFNAVLWIRIRMFLDLSDPDPPLFVRIMQK